jgi:hypothetical protein
VIALREIAEEDTNKSIRPIQNPLLVTETRTRDNKNNNKRTTLGLGTDKSLLLFQRLNTSTQNLARISCHMKLSEWSKL